MSSRCTGDVAVAGEMTRTRIVAVSASRAFAGMALNDMRTNASPTVLVRSAVVVVANARHCSLRMSCTFCLKSRFYGTYV